MTREELIESLTVLKEQARYYGDNTFIWSINIDSFNFVIGSAVKTIEQEPRKGKWIKHNTPSNTYYYDCSLCGCAAPCIEFADSYLWKLSNFCPDCGADMRED